MRLMGGPDKKQEVIFRLKKGFKEQMGKKIRGSIHRAGVKSRKDTGLKFTREGMRFISHYQPHGPFIISKVVCIEFFDKNCELGLGLSSRVPA